MNFVPDMNCGKDFFIFYGNKRKYETGKRSDIPVILSSNIVPEGDGKNVFVVNYRDLIHAEPGIKYFDNSAVMLLNLLNLLFVKKIFIAGFDGFDTSAKSNFCDELQNDERFEKDYEIINHDVTQLLKEFAASLSDDVSVSFLTESRFASAFAKQ